MRRILLPIAFALLGVVQLMAQQNRGTHFIDTNKGDTLWNDDAWLTKDTSFEEYDAKNSLQANLPYVLFGLLVVLAAAGVGACVHRNRKIFSIVELTRNQKHTTIHIKNMTEAEVKAAVDDFLKLYPEIALDPIKYTWEGEQLTLELSPDVDFTESALLVNSLIYSNRDKRHNKDITGWYTFGQVKSGRVDLCDKKVKLFIPESDEEYDCLYVGTDDGTTLKYCFIDWRATVV